jgi:phage-related protein
MNGSASGCTKVTLDGGINLVKKIGNTIGNGIRRARRAGRKLVKKIGSRIGNGIRRAGRAIRSLFA